MKKKPGTSLLLAVTLPLWGLLAAGIITKNGLVITAFVVCFAAIALTLIIRKVRILGGEKRERARIWQSGLAGKARIVSVGKASGGMNGDDNIKFVLEVQLDNQEAYQASTRMLISRLAIPRIQPGCMIEIRVDKDNPQNVIIDPALTPYQHYELTE